MRELEWRQYRRHLPHWRADGATYFVTWRLHRHQTDLRPTERDELVQVLRHFQGVRYDLQAFVVMNDHVHVLVRAYEQWRLEQIIHSWKAFSSRLLQRQYGRRAPVWQAEYMDRVVRNEIEFEQKLEYIVGNPQKRWPGITDYAWAGVATDGELGGYRDPPY